MAAACDGEKTKADIPTCVFSSPNNRLPLDEMQEASHSEKQVMGDSWYGGREAGRGFCCDPAHQQSIGLLAKVERVFFLFSRSQRLAPNRFFFSLPCPKKILRAGKKKNGLGPMGPILKSTLVPMAAKQTKKKDETHTPRTQDGPIATSCQGRMAADHELLLRSIVVVAARSGVSSDPRRGLVRHGLVCAIAGHFSIH